MPSISVEGEVPALAADPETVEVLEQCVINWLNQISAAVESQLKKTPQVTCAVLLKIFDRVHACLPEKGRESGSPCGLASSLTVLYLPKRWK